MAAPATPTSPRNALRVNVVFTTVSFGPGLPYLTGRAGLAVGHGRFANRPDYESPLCTLRITPGSVRCLRVVWMPDRGASHSARPSRWSRGLRRRVRG